MVNLAGGTNARIALLGRRVRKTLSLVLVLAGWAIMLTWLFGGVSTKFAIDGGYVPTWQAELGVALLFWPVLGPIWFDIILLAICGPIVSLLGWVRLAWGLRVISLPLGAFAVWALKTDTISGDRPSIVAMLIFVAAVWVAPIRRRKSALHADGTISNGGDVSS